MRKPIKPAPRGKTWVLVADTTRARLFASAQSAAPLVEIEDLLNPYGRLREQDLDSDSRGRLVSGRRGGGHRAHVAARSDKPRREQDARAFARAICARLNSLQRHGKLAKLYVIAEPDLIGMLRQQMTPPVQTLVAGEFAKNLTRASVCGIREALPARL
ncbi:MAG: host attachment protein [Gammaproteobacteria bacterium]|nr:host attachment protein [Gammaproteobacteria bacterium]